MNVEPIIIASAVDDGYAQHLGVMLFSLCKNRKSNVIIKVFVIDCGISTLNRDKLNKLAINEQFQLSFIVPPERMFQDCPISAYVTSATYYRLAIDQLLPAWVLKVLYLDADMLVTGDITQLWNNDVDRYTIGAVQDFVDEGYYNKGIQNVITPPFFNAGVMLINVKKWKEEKVYERAYKYTIDNSRNLFCWDQESLNYVLNKRWKSLPLQYNVTTSLFDRKFVGKLTQDKINSIKEATQHPAVIHFTSFQKPWKRFWRHRHTALYLEYIKMTPWKDFQPVFPTSREAKKYFIEKYTPENVRLIYERLKKFLRNRK